MFLATLAEKVIAPAEGKVKALEERRRMIEARAPSVLAPGGRGCGVGVASFPQLGPVSVGSCSVGSCRKSRSR